MEENAAIEAAIYGLFCVHISQSIANIISFYENPVELAVFATKFLELIPMFFRTLHKLKKKTVPFIQQTTV